LARHTVTQDLFVDYFSHELSKLKKDRKASAQQGARRIRAKPPERMHPTIEAALDRPHAGIQARATQPPEEADADRERCARESRPMPETELCRELHSNVWGRGALRQRLG
jgi:hypothetical protein